MSPRSSSLLRGLAAGLGLALALVAAPRAADEKDYSAAERMIFTTDQLANVKAPATLTYRFKKSGSLEDGFEDKVAIHVGKAADGRCCTTRGEFLSGARKLELPEVPEAHANPVILYFLEHDVRDMHRLTKGQDAHFRRMIRMAIYDGANIADTTLRYKGRELKGSEVSIAPYLDDKQRQRFEKFAKKRYQFLLSDEVPGGVYGIRTTIEAERSDAPPLIVEELYIDGAEATAGNKGGGSKS